MCCVLFLAGRGGDGGVASLQLLKIQAINCSVSVAPLAAKAAEASNLLKMTVYIYLQKKHCNSAFSVSDHVTEANQQLLVKEAALQSRFRYSSKQQAYASP